MGFGVSPAEKAAARKRQKEIKEAIEICGSAPFSRETNPIAASWRHTNIDHRRPPDGSGGIEKAHA